MAAGANEMEKSASIVRSYYGIWQIEEWRCLGFATWKTAKDALSEKDAQSNHCSSDVQTFHKHPVSLYFAFSLALLFLHSRRFQNHSVTFLMPYMSESKSPQSFYSFRISFEFYWKGSIKGSPHFFNSKNAKTSRKLQKMHTYVSDTNWTTYWNNDLQASKIVEIGKYVTKKTTKFQTLFRR